METFEIIFLLYIGVTPPIPTTNFYLLCNFLMVLWNKRFFGFLKLLMLQRNGHPCIVIHVRSKLTQNISHLQEWHQNTQSEKSLFMRRFTHYMAFIRREKKKNPAHNDHIWLTVVLCRCFIRRPHVQDNHF